MNSMKKLLMSILGLSFLVYGAGCSDDASPVGSVQLTLSATGSNSVNTGGRIDRTDGTAIITDFQISIRDVIFKTDADDDGNSDDSTDVVFSGPYQVDLLNGSDALSQTIGSAEVPNGVYQELRFKFHKDENLPTDAPLYDKSIYIAGTIDDVPFEMWHDTSENLDIGKSTGVVVNENNVSLNVVFNVDQFLSSLNTIDLTTATDGNDDGTIEIHPNDPDGNKDIADALKDNIKEAADLLVN